MLDKIVLIGTLVGNLTVTSYRSVPEQTDDSPYNTSTGESVHNGGVAISRDLLCGACRKLHHRCKHPEYNKKLHYGDWLYVPGNGFYRVNDVMGATKYDRGTKRRCTIKQAVDLWVPTYKDEKAVGVQIKTVYKVDAQ